MQRWESDRVPPLLSEVSLLTHPALSRFGTRRFALGPVTWFHLFGKINQSSAKFTPSRLLIQPPPSGTISATPTIGPIMAEIKIDKTLFQERLSHFVAAWKADKRSGDALFNGASSILVLMGKTEEAAQFQKNNAIHVRIPNIGPLPQLRSDVFCSFGSLGYEFPATHLPSNPRRPIHLSRLRRERYDITPRSCAKCHRRLTLSQPSILEPLKGGKIPLHVLVRGKDAEQTNSSSTDITAHIKAAGVSHRRPLASEF